MVKTSSESPIAEMSDTGDDRIVTVEEGAEAFVELLNANNVDYIFGLSKNERLKTKLFKQMKKANISKLYHHKFSGGKL